MDSKRHHSSIYAETNGNAVTRHAGLSSGCYIALALLEKQLEPILLYGSDIWGLPGCNRHILIVNDNDTKIKDQTIKKLKVVLDKDNMIEAVKPNRNQNVIHVENKFNSRYCKLIIGLLKSSSAMRASSGLHIPKAIKAAIKSV